MFKGSPSVKILQKKVPQTIPASFLTPQNQANAHLNLDNSPLKNNIRDVGSTVDLVLVLLVHLVHWYLVHGLIGTSGALVPGTLVPTVT